MIRVQWYRRGEQFRRWQNNWPRLASVGLQLGGTLVLHTRDNDIAGDRVIALSFLIYGGRDWLCWAVDDL